MSEITYEVYVLQAGKWTIESRYSKTEREEAIGDAKAMHENPAVVAVKVIKETYDSDTGANYESTVFTTEAAKPSLGGSGGFANMEVNVEKTDFAEMSFGDGGFDEDYSDVKMPKKKAKKKSVPTGKNPIAMIFMKILFITSVSLGFAFAATFVYSGGLLG